MKRTDRWGLLVACALLAGCVQATPEVAPGAGGDGPAATLGDGGRVLPWGLSKCTYAVWFVPAPADRVGARLPDGFTPAGGTTLGRLTGSEAYLGFEAFECELGAGLNGPVSPLSYASLFTAVSPPDAVADPEVGGQHYFKWETLVPDRERRSVLREAGLPAEGGEATVGDSGGALLASFTLDGAGTFGISGVAGSASPVGGIPFLEFSQATTGLARWRAATANATSAAGTGVWTAEPGSWPAEMLGATRGTARFNTGTWDFVNATLEIPAN